MDNNSNIIIIFFITMLHREDMGGHCKSRLSADLSQQVVRYEDLRMRGEKGYKCGFTPTMELDYRFGVSWKRGEGPQGQEACEQNQRETSERARERVEQSISARDTRAV